MNLNEEHHEDEQLDQQEKQTSQLAEEEEKCLKTKHATDIKKIIGSSAELTQFDNLRYHLKCAKNISDAEKIIYKKLFLQTPSAAHVL